MIQRTKLCLSSVLKIFCSVIVHSVWPQLFTKTSFIDMIICSSFLGMELKDKCIYPILLFMPCWKKWITDTQRGRQRHQNQCSCKPHRKLRGRFRCVFHFNTLGNRVWTNHIWTLKASKTTNGIWVTIQNSGFAKILL